MRTAWFGLALASLFAAVWLARYDIQPIGQGAAYLKADR